jgi:hypothetical protein
VRLILGIDRGEHGKLRAFHGFEGSGARIGDRCWSGTGHGDFVEEKGKGAKNREPDLLARVFKRSARGRMRMRWTQAGVSAKA